MKPLPSDGPRRTMFITALREYSNTCAPGDIHADCPFAIPTSAGVLGCGEECLDALAELEAGGHSDVTHLWAGIAARPLRRARAGPTPGSVPFDSRAAYLQERESPVARRSPSALLLGLADILTEPPRPGETQEKSRELVNEVVSELYRRGFDVDALLREVFTPIIAQAIASWIVVALVAGDQRPDDWTYPERSGWADVLVGGSFAAAVERLHAEGPKAVADSVAEILTRGRHKVAHWLSTLPLDELVVWSVPTPAQYEVLDDTRVDRGGKQQWLFDRFVGTYLDNWSTESLHREWGYLFGKEVPACNPSQMRTRRIDRNDIAVAIAHRATDESAASDSSAVPIASKYVRVAVDLLRQGNRPAAAGIFDVVCEVSFRSGEAFNNRGFCNLPDDPEKALADFERAFQLGHFDIALVVANRMLALHRLGRNSTALEVGEDYWEDRASYTGGAFVWDFQSEVPLVMKVSNTDTYLADLAAFIAERSGDDVRAELWTSRSSK